MGYDTLLLGSSPPPLKSSCWSRILQWFPGCYNLFSKLSQHCAFVKCIAISNVRMPPSLEVHSRGLLLDLRSFLQYRCPEPADTKATTMTWISMSFHCTFLYSWIFYRKSQRRSWAQWCLRRWCVLAVEWRFLSKTSSLVQISLKQRTHETSTLKIRLSFSYFFSLS